MKTKYLFLVAASFLFITYIKAQNPDSAAVEAGISKMLKTQYAGTPADSRNFFWEAVDLNGDKKNEYLVGLSGTQWCGDEGCTMLVLNHNYGIITKMTSVDYPVYVGNTADAVKGWASIYVTTKNGTAKMSWNGNKYPGSPATAPATNESTSTMQPVLQAKRAPASF